MSAETLQAMEAAVRAHVEAEHEDDGCMLTDWVVSFATYNPGEESFSSSYSVAALTSPHAALGLLGMTDAYIRADMRPVDDEADDE